MITPRSHHTHGCNSRPPTACGWLTIAYAEQAGFAQVEVLPIEHDFWRFYRLLP